MGDLSKFLNTLQGQLDPTRILQSVLPAGAKVADWQHEFARAASVPGSWTMVCASRRSGKTSMVSAMALASATIPNQRVVVLAPRLDQSRAIVEEVVRMATESPLLDIPFRETQLRIDWENGSRLEAIPAGDGTQVRGVGVGAGEGGSLLLIFEESAFLPGGGDAVFSAAAPALEGVGRAAIITTPSVASMENRSYAYWRDVQTYPHIHRIEARAEDLDYMAPKIALARKAMSEAEIKREFSCQWLDPSGVNLVDLDRLNASKIERKGLNLADIYS